MCYTGTCHNEYEDGSCRLNKPSAADCENVPIEVEDEDKIILEARGAFRNMKAISNLAGIGYG